MKLHGAVWRAAQGFEPAKLASLLCLGRFNARGGSESFLGVGVCRMCFALVSFCLGDVDVF